MDWSQDNNDLPQTGEISTGKYIVGWAFYRCNKGKGNLLTGVQQLLQEIVNIYIHT